ncbi:hypothetical protein ACM6Q7_23705 [Peribacillus butanolivorans]
MNAGRYGVNGMIMPTLKEKLFANKTREIKDAAFFLYVDSKDRQYRWSFLQSSC